MFKFSNYSLRAIILLTSLIPKTEKKVFPFLKNIRQIPYGLKLHNLDNWKKNLWKIKELNNVLGFRYCYRDVYLHITLLIHYKQPFCKPAILLPKGCFISLANFDGPSFSLSPVASHLLLSHLPIHFQWKMLRLVDVRKATLRLWKLPKSFKRMSRRNFIIWNSSVKDYLVHFPIQYIPVSNLFQTSYPA